MNHNKLIILGTNPEQKNGGIAFAIPGHLAAYRALGFNPSYVVTHNSESWSGKWLPWLKAWPSLVKHIIATRKAGNAPVVLCHVGGGIPSMLRKSSLAWLARSMGARVIMQLHGPEVDAYLSSGIGRRLFSFLLMPANSVAVLTPWWQSRLQSAGISKPTFVIPNPLPAQWQVTAKQLRFAKKDNCFINILAVTRLEAGKGIDDLIEAIQLLPDKFHLDIAGTGSQCDHLKGMVDNFGLQNRVHFHGWVSGDKKQALFDQADIFCLPSRYDSFGMGYLEAMANGLPIVAYDWGPIADVVPDNRCGLLAAEYTPAAVAEEIKKLESASCREQMGCAAKEWVLERFSMQSVALKLKDLFWQPEK